MVSVCSAAKKKKKLVGGGEVRSTPNATCGHAGIKRLKWIFCGARMRVWLIYMSSNCHRLIHRLCLSDLLCAVHLKLCEGGWDACWQRRDTKPAT